jgi:hypothetical protein
MGGGVVVELQGARERVEDLLGGMLVSPLFEAYVVVAADAGQHCHLFAAQAGHAPSAAEVGDADVVWPYELAPGTQVLTDEVVVRHATTIRPTVVSTLALSIPGTTGLLWGFCAAATLDA